MVMSTRSRRSEILGQSPRSPIRVGAWVTLACESMLVGYEVGADPIAIGVCTDFAGMALGSTPTAVGYDPYGVVIPSPVAPRECVSTTPAYPS